MPIEQYENGTEGKEFKNNGGKTKYDWNSTTCSSLRITYIHITVLQLKSKMER